MHIPWFARSIIKQCRASSQSDISYHTKVTITVQLFLREIFFFKISLAKNAKSFGVSCTFFDYQVFARIIRKKNPLWKLCVIV